MRIFELYEPENPAAPILLSIPHSGTYIPDHIREMMRAEMLKDLDDTDWYLNEVYAFAKEMDIPVISANFHRWVVDLNRDPSGKPLYKDGRIMTDIMPVSDFHGRDLYRDFKLPDESRRDIRIQRYHEPYHMRIGNLLKKLRREYGRVFLWDAHSIRRHLPGIHPNPFPDFILGTDGGRTCSEAFEKAIGEVLAQSGRTVESNTLFKGGFITRKFGNPKENIHSFQLEMCKDLYMTDDERRLDSTSAETLSITLKKAFEKLIDIL